MGTIAALCLFQKKTWNRDIGACWRAISGILISKIQIYRCNNSENDNSLNLDDNR